MRIEPYNAFSDSLNHHGIKGQKWGVRRYDYVAKGLRNRDNPEDPSKRAREGINPTPSKRRSSSGSDILRNKGITEEEAARREKLKKMAKYTALAGGIALGAYGAYKIHSMNAEQQRQLLETLSKIDKNVTTRGWDRKVQDKLQKEVNSALDIATQARKRSEELYQEKQRSLMEVNAADALGWSREQWASHNKKIAAAYDTKISRANKASLAASQLFEISKQDLDEYATIDPRNVTKAQAVKNTFRSSTGNVKNAIKDAGLTKAARAEKAKDLIEANRVKEIDRKIKDIQKKDAKKILEAYVKDPESFLNGDTIVPDYMQISENKIEKLRKQIIQPR